MGTRSCAFRGKTKAQFAITLLFLCSTRAWDSYWLLGTVKWWWVDEEGSCRNGGWKMEGVFRRGAYFNGGVVKLFWFLKFI